MRRCGWWLRSLVNSYDYYFFRVFLFLRLLLLSCVLPSFLSFPLAVNKRADGRNGENAAAVIIISFLSFLSKPPSLHLALAYICLRAATTLKLTNSRLSSQLKIYIALTRSKLLFTYCFPQYWNKNILLENQNMKCFWPMENLSLDCLTFFLLSFTPPCFEGSSGRCCGGVKEKIADRSACARLSPPSAVAPTASCCLERKQQA